MYPMTSTQEPKMTAKRTVPPATPIGYYVRGSATARALRAALEAEAKKAKS